jgi:hypothetical protein
MLKAKAKRDQELRDKAEEEAKKEEPEDEDDEP